MTKAAMTIVCFRETDAERWVAQCLEFDLCASADSLTGVLKALHANMDGHELICKEEGLVPLEPLPEAPARYWRMLPERRSGGEEG
jgi:hypothetical protein